MDSVWNKWPRDNTKLEGILFAFVFVPMENNFELILQAKIQILHENNYRYTYTIHVYHPSLLKFNSFGDATRWIPDPAEKTSSSISQCCLSVRLLERTEHQLNFN